MLLIIVTASSSRKFPIVYNYRLRYNAKNYESWQTNNNEQLTFWATLYITSLRIIHDSRQSAEL